MYLQYITTRSDTLPKGDLDRHGRRTDVPSGPSHGSSDEEQRTPINSFTQRNYTFHSKVSMYSSGGPIYHPILRSKDFRLKHHVLNFGKSFQDRETPYCSKEVPFFPEGFGRHEETHLPFESCPSINPFGDQYQKTSLSRNKYS